jgi:hypothetical protein
MKPKNTGLLSPRKALRTLFIAAASLFSTASNAQTIIGASFAESVIATGIDARNVNADMLYNWGGGHLRAVAYDDFNTGNGFVNLRDWTGANITIPIPGGLFPDIVLGDDMSNPGNDYILAVIYGASVTRMRTYSITGTGTGTLTATLTSAQQISIPGSATSRYPHIDLYADVNNWINGWPALHEFVITWSEALTGSPGMDVFATHGDLMSPTTLAPYYQITTSGTGMMSDVAALLEKTTSTGFAYIPFYNTSSGDMDMAELDIANATFTVTSSLASPMQTLPRIDAMTLNYFGSGWQRYQVGYQQYNGSVEEIWGYNDLTGNTNLSNAGFSSWNSLQPAVAAGPGPGFGVPDYGNDNYTEAWHIPSVTRYCAQSIDVTTGNISTTFPDYYICNLNAMTASGGFAYSPIAVSTSTNIGARLLTAWSGNGRVWYKYNSNTASYKQPTSVEEAAKASQYTMFPNPATNVLHIQGAVNADYTVTDVTGRVLLQGKLDSRNNTIAIENLAKGFYVANIIEKDVTTLLKFTKE